MIALASSAARRRARRGIGGVLLVSGFLALWPLQRSIDEEQGAGRALTDVLYMPSGKILRRLSLGYEGLLADIYWTRVVQYFGRRRMAHATRFELLGPLLRITTELDPQLLIAYRYGSIFLAEKPPGGAGQPDQALVLLRRGIVANPDYWRLWQDLGFIYYWDLKDYPSAARVFRVGSERPGAMLWMRVLAASVAARGGEIETSRLLWREIGRQAGNDQIRRSAEEHLAALEAQEQINRLNALLDRFRERKGRTARTFQDLLAPGYMAPPRDPSGTPYIIGSDGRAALGPHSKVDLRLLQ
jgi:hypothetical protein